jgi:hypothetical protein
MRTLRRPRRTFSALPDAARAFATLREHAAPKPFRNPQAEPSEKPELDGARAQYK